MQLDEYKFPAEPVDAETMSLHVIEVSPKEYIEIVVDDRRYIIQKQEQSFKIGDLIHFKPVDEAKIKPTLFNRLKRFFRGDSEAFRVYTVSNLFVITCVDRIPDCKYQVLGLRSLRS